MPHHPPLPKAPLPTREIFDPFNSSSTGHQRAESRLAGSTSWRDSRTYKLAHQFRDPSGRGGTQHRSDLVGANSVNWRKDGRKENFDWEEGAAGLREVGWQDIRGLMSGSWKRTSEEADNKAAFAKKPRTDASNHDDNGDGSTAGILPFYATVQSAKHPSSYEKPAGAYTGAATAAAADACPKTPPQIFKGLNMYLNGSTAPEVSDYKLKQLFMQHGGNSSLALGTRTVTHVILGKSCGGGLASGKINKEVTTIGGKGIKYVTAQWILDSVEKRIRQPEGRYMPSQIARRIGGRGQISVQAMFSSTRTEKQTQENHDNNNG